MTVLNILGLDGFSRSAPSHMTFSLRPNTMRFQSPITETVQTAELPGARWVSTFGWQNLTDSDARVIKARLAKLRGMAGRFYLYDAIHPVPAGSALGAGTVKGAGQAGQALVTAWPMIRVPSAVRCDSATVKCDSATITCDSGDAGYADALLPGDYIGVNGELKIVTDPVTVDGLGSATVIFEPPLRSSPPDGAAVTINKPSCVMILVDDNQDNFAFSEPNVTSIQIECMEVFQ